MEFLNKLGLKILINLLVCLTAISLIPWLCAAFWQEITANDK